MTIWAAESDRQLGSWKDAKPRHLSSNRHRWTRSTPRWWTKFFTIHLRSETSHQRQRFGRDGPQRQGRAVIAGWRATNAIGPRFFARFGRSKSLQGGRVRCEAFAIGQTCHFQKPES